MGFSWRFFLINASCSISFKVRTPLLLTLQDKTHTQAEKKGISTPARQPPPTPTSVPKAVPTQQQGAKEKVAFKGVHH